MKILGGAARLVAQLVITAVATFLAAALFMYVLISFGGEPLLDSNVGGTLFGVGIVVGFFALLHTFRTS